MRAPGFAVVICLMLTSTVSAQTTDWRFRFQPGQTLLYRVKHTTTIEETVGGTTTTATARIDLTKRWQVLAVDGQGIATMEMAITEMRNEQIRPNGEVVLFDSLMPDKSAPELREQMGKFIGQPLAVVRVDRAGRVLEVIQGTSNRYDVEPPFVLTLPPIAMQAGQGWDRAYMINVEPAPKKMERYAAQQKYTCFGIANGMATIAITTMLSGLPSSKAGEMQLIQKLPEGECVFDLQHGRLHSAHMTVDRRVDDHDGQGSSYHFQSQYSEQYAER